MAAPLVAGIATAAPPLTGRDEGAALVDWIMRPGAVMSGGGAFFRIRK